MDIGICEQRFHCLEIPRSQKDLRFHNEGICIRRFPRKDAVKRGESFGKTAQLTISKREIVISIGVARIELNGAAQPRNRLVPMPKPSLDIGDRTGDINVIWKALFSLLEFRERPGEIARNSDNNQEQGEFPAGSGRARAHDPGNP